MPMHRGCVRSWARLKGWARPPRAPRHSLTNESARRGSIHRTDDIITRESTGCSDGTVVIQMKYAKGITLHSSRSTLLGASLCGLLGLSAACTAETQPLNSVA